MMGKCAGTSALLAAALAASFAACSGSTVPLDTSTSSGSSSGASSGSGSDAAVAPFGDECPTGSVFVDDFTSDPATRWQTVAGAWQVAAGAYSAVAGSPDAIVWLGPRPHWTNYRIEARLRPEAGSGNAGLIFRVQDVGLPSDGGVPANNAGAMYWGGIWVASSEVMLGYMDGSYHSAGTAPATLTAGQWYDLRVDVVGSSISVYLDGHLVRSAVDSRYKGGSVGLRAWNLSLSCSMVKVTCL